MRKNTWQKLAHQRHYERHVATSDDEIVTAYLQKLHEKPTWPRINPAGTTERQTWLGYSRMATADALARAASQLIDEQTPLVMSRIANMQLGDKLAIRTPRMVPTSDVDPRLTGSGLLMSPDGKTRFLRTSRMCAIVARNQTPLPRVIDKTNAHVEDLVNGITAYCDLQAEFLTRDQTNRTSDRDLTSTLKRNAEFRLCSKLEQAALLMSFDDTFESPIVFKNLADERSGRTSEQLWVRLDDKQGETSWLLVERSNDPNLPKSAQWKNGYALSVIPDKSRDLAPGARPTPDFAKATRMRTAQDVARATKRHTNLGNALRDFAAKAEETTLLDDITNDVARKARSAHPLDAQLLKAALISGATVEFRPIRGLKGEASMRGLLSDGSALYVNAHLPQRHGDATSIDVRHKWRDGPSATLERHYEEARAKAPELPAITKALQDALIRQSGKTEKQTVVTGIPLPTTGDTEDIGKVAELSHS